MANVLYLLTLAVVLPLISGWAGQPFLVRLIQNGFATSEINVVYIVADKTVDDGEFLTGEYPRVFVPRLEDQFISKNAKRRQFRIAAQSLVVIDGRNVPVRDGKYFMYLLQEMNRVLNPGSNKFVLLISPTIHEGDGSDLKQFSDAVCSMGIGYTLLLSYGRVNASGEPTLMTRISFGQSITMTNWSVSADFRHLFRFDIRSTDGMLVSGVLYNFFPFTYITPSGHWDGSDFRMWSILAGHLRLRLQFRYAKAGSDLIGGAYSQAMRNKLVNFIASRDMLVNDGLPKISLAARDYFSLVVPRPLTLNLMNALLQPFRSEVWMLIAILLGVRLLVTHVHGSVSVQNKRGMVRRLRQTFNIVEPWVGWIKLASNVLTFLLIEAYLAQVTSLLLTLRYVEGPKNLEQFLASHMPIVEPVEQELSLAQLGPERKAQLKTHFVKRTEEELSQRTLEDAYVELRSRVLFLSYGSEPIDAATGKRNYYILDDPLAVVRFQYSFAKDTAFKQVAERCFLYYEENGLRWHVEEYYSRWAKIQHLRQQYGINGTVLKFSDLHSLWICTGIGWCLSAVVFSVEWFLQSRLFQRMCQRNWVRKWWPNFEISVDLMHHS